MQKSKNPKNQETEKLTIEMMAQKIRNTDKKKIKFQVKRKKLHGES